MYGTGGLGYITRSANVLCSPHLQQLLNIVEAAGIARLAAKDGADILLMKSMEMYTAVPSTRPTPASVATRHAKQI